MLVGWYSRKVKVDYEQVGPFVVRDGPAFVSGYFVEKKGLFLLQLAFLR